MGIVREENSESPSLKVKPHVGTVAVKLDVLLVLVALGLTAFIDGLPADAITAMDHILDIDVTPVRFEASLRHELAVAPRHTGSEAVPINYDIAIGQIRLRGQFTQPLECEWKKRVKAFIPCGISEIINNHDCGWVG